MAENMETIRNDFEAALLQLNRVKAAELFDQCYSDGNQFEELEQLAIQSLEKIGAGWENGTISLSQVYMSGVICEELIDKYLPKMLIKRKDIPRMAIAVLLDHHALGKRIVYSVLRAGGFEILDFGQGLSVEALVSKTIDQRIEILLISTLMLPSAMKVKAVKEQLAAQGAFPKIVVGGAPFRLDANLWRAVGADADGKNAVNIADTIEALVKGVDANELV